MLAKVTMLLLAATAAFSIHALDLKAVEVDVKMHPDRFRELLNRFEQADTTLTPTELATIYFGYSFTADYDPTESFDEIGQAYDSGNYERASQLCKEALELNPVSLELNVLALAAADRMSGKAYSGADILHFGIRSDLIATAILESGRGTMATSPFFVISKADMERLLTNVLGIERIVDRTKVGDVDAIKVVFPGSDRQHILYSDNSREQMFMISQPR